MLKGGFVMTNPSLLGPWVRRFLIEHLIGERNLSHNTQASYRDTLALLLPFAAQAVKCPLDRLIIESLSAAIVRRFLGYIENTRGCSIATRNQRLAAIHSLARFIALHNPEYLAWYTEIRAVPFKKTAKPTLAYLEKPEMDALLNLPDRHTKLGGRDYALVLFLYNTGARAQEVADLVIADLTLKGSPSVRIVGKGGKVRHCPLWTSTAEALNVLVANRQAHDPVFLNRRQQPLTRFGIGALIKRLVKQARQETPSLCKKAVSVHTIRHTTAVHLLRAGVDINTIRAWLGHVSLDTTNIYAEIDLEMKAEALAHCEVPATSSTDHWRKNPDLMAFLKTL
jgi:site-specific recombinase XerD